MNESYIKIGHVKATNLLSQITPLREELGVYLEEIRSIEKHFEVWVTNHINASSVSVIQTARKYGFFTLLMTPKKRKKFIASQLRNDFLFDDDFLKIYEYVSKNNGRTSLMCLYDQLIDVEWEIKRLLKVEPISRHYYVSNNLMLPLRFLPEEKDIRNHCDMMNNEIDTLVNKHKQEVVEELD